MIRYFDTGQNGAADSLGHWLDRELVSGVRSFRGQFGFFDGAALRPFVPVLQGMVAAGGTLRLVIGANTGDPPTTADLAVLLSLVGPADRTALTVVALSGALFHPKAMHLERADGRKFGVVSSANFTRKGLGHSVEAGLILESVAATDVTVEQIAAAIDRWATAADSGVYQVRTADDIEVLRAHGLAVTSAARRAIRSRQRTGATSTGRGTRHVGWRPPAAPAELPEDEAEEIEEAVELAAVTAAAPVTFTLMWQSKPLKNRDLTIPEGESSNQTGSMNLDKGLLSTEVDHRHFFRDRVFEYLNWEPTKKPTVQKTFAKFRLYVDGTDLGEFDTRIAHTTSTNTQSYLQKNAMTRLSWGPMREHIARSDLIGRTLSLYRREDNPTQFALKIDA